ncbi:MAG: UDP-2,3-diacylglucosamine diphosphatase LpxI [Rhodospirillaceae bacterium]|nr:UDP-2,3-diacylglucosamine diphosphatase LpxI [Rhodospirillaceae bacterium]MDD9917026.1 UDP-2,3-diacylglucosamine diphosphatase LpxI [Rhodospirillaceae bacterium]MDD9929410.1 UDP-2,3-diacylglucosamine diphosphatase LpxI [Rhodospirillaceae bacterium]
MTRKLGILAGGGVLPRLLVAACHTQERPVFVLAFEGYTDAETTQGVEHAWVRLGAAGKALKCLRDAGAEDLVLAGPVRRPSLMDLRPDATALKFFAKAGGKAMGDDSLLRGVIRMLEEDEGFRVVGVDDVLGGITAPEGTLGTHVPDAEAERDIRRGVEVVRALGAADVGQAAIVQDGIVLGVEAVEGTDALLQRCIGLRREGPGGVLVKLSKPGQEKRADLPTIGTDTVARAKEAGLRGIAIEAGLTLVIASDAVIEAADAAGLFVIGLSASS